MTVKGSRVDVDQTPTLLTSAPSDSSSRQVVALRNTHATESVDLGDAEVEYGSGYELIAGGQVEMDLGSGESLYGIANTGQTVTVHVLEAGV